MRSLTVIMLVLLLAVVGATSSFAQTQTQTQTQAPADGWHFTIAPYIFGSAMNGTTVVAGQELKVDMSFGDILDNLQFGAMGIVVARKGNWGVGGDAIWMALGSTGTTVGPAAITGAADMNQGAFAFYGLRRVKPWADFMFGGRVNTLDANLRFNGPGASDVGGSKTWFDPIVGLQLKTPPTGKRWHAQVYTEIGGFGVGSTFTWQVFPTVGVNVTKLLSLEFGYRWLDIDYSTGADLTLFKYDVLTQGPILGFAFRF